MISLVQKKYALCPRFSRDDFTETDTGSLFFVGQDYVDMNDTEIVHSGVDTVRQIFHGRINQSMLERIIQVSKEKDSLLQLTSNNHTLSWHVSRLPRSSHYRFKVQSNELGVVVLFGHWDSKLDNEGSHLKVELSPEFIDRYKVSGCMNFMSGNAYNGRGIAGLFLDDFTFHGVAIHIAVDYQGNSSVLPSEFLDNFSTRMRTFRTFTGVSEIDLSGISESVTTYGRHAGQKNYLIGKAGHTQLCLYDKTQDAINRDKIDYWKEAWNRYTPYYNESLPVRRIELRFHQSVLRELGNSLNLNFDSFQDVEPYLTDLWRYGLENNRLETSVGKKISFESVDEETGEILTKYKYVKYLHPLWQIFLTDVHITVPPLNVSLRRKKKESVDPIKHNVTSLYGNYVSMCARMNLSAKQSLTGLKKLPIYEYIESYYRSTGLNSSDILQKLEKDLALRRITGKAA